MEVALFLTALQKLKNSTRETKIKVIVEKTAGFSGFISYLPGHRGGDKAERVQ